MNKLIARKRVGFKLPAPETLIGICFSPCVDALYFWCLQILSWAGSTLTGIHMSSGQGMYSSAILIFLLPWIQSLQEEAEIYSIFVGCGVDPEAIVS